MCTFVRKTEKKTFGFLNCIHLVWCWSYVERLYCRQCCVYSFRCVVFFHYVFTESISLMCTFQYRVVVEFSFLFMCYSCRVPCVCAPLSRCFYFFFSLMLRGFNALFVFSFFFSLLCRLLCGCVFFIQLNFSCSFLFVSDSQIFCIFLGLFWITHNDRIKNTNVLNACDIHRHLQQILFITWGIVFQDWMRYFTGHHKYSQWRYYNNNTTLFFLSLTIIMGSFDLRNDYQN